MLEEKYAEIQSVDKALENVKGKVAQEIELPLSIRWEDAMSALLMALEERKLRVNEINSEIIGKFILGQAITDFKVDEDQKIESALEMFNIINHINDIIKKYTKISLDGNNIRFHSEFEDVLMGDLSTDAQE